MYNTMNNFGQEKCDHLSDEFIQKCMLNNNTGVKALIEKLHFSDDVPDNKNIRLRSLKNNLVEVIKNDKWIPKDANEAMDSMIRKGFLIMNKCYNDENTWIKEKDVNELDLRIQNFLIEIMDKGNKNYFELRRRILALVIEYSDI